MQKLMTGAAYHGNRMLHHAQHDLREMAESGMNLVVHMFSHNDWQRHCRVMKDMVELSYEEGLEVWVDNWGLGGPPGEISYFLAQHPEAHMYYTDGAMDPVRACLNAPAFRSFVHEWIDTVAFIGARTIFWDEPQIPTAKNGALACACPICRKKFEERYGRPMPEGAGKDPDMEAFRTDTIVEFFEDICGYSTSKGLKNTVCIMPNETVGIGMTTLDRLCAVETLDNIGSDPYWGYRTDPYEYVYNGTKTTIDIANRFKKDHNIWIQAYATPRGQEEEIVQATEAAYDAGARTILSWSYMSGISNDYAAKNAPVAWAAQKQAFARIREMERDRILHENRVKMGLLRP